MKIDIKIKELSHEDIVNLMSDGLYDSPYLVAKYDRVHYRHAFGEGLCFEEILASILLDGGSIEIGDTNVMSEDEKYGKLNARYDADNQVMFYTVTLKDIISGLELAAQTEGGGQYIINFINGDTDWIEADYLMQHIVFQEYLYG